MGGQRRCFEGDGDRFTLSIHHLAGHGALPNQLVELEFIRAQRRRKGGWGREHFTRRANSFVGFLGVFGLSFIEPGFTGHSACAIEGGGCLPGSAHGLGREGYRVGAHIRNVTVFIQALGDAHGLLRGKPQLTTGFLLQGGGRERGRWPAGVRLCLHGEHSGLDPRALQQFGHHCRVSLREQDSLSF